MHTGGLCTKTRMSDTLDGRRQMSLSPEVRLQRETGKAFAAHGVCLENKSHNHANTTYIRASHDRGSRVVTAAASRRR